MRFRGAPVAVLSTALILASCQQSDDSSSSAPDSAASGMESSTTALESGGGDSSDDASRSDDGPSTMAEATPVDTGDHVETGADDAETTPADESGARSSSDAGDAVAAPGPDANAAAEASASDADTLPDSDAGVVPTVDALDVSPTSIQIDGECGEARPSESLPAQPADGTSTQIVVKNMTNQPVSWTATLNGDPFTLDLAGATLAAAGSATINVGTLPIPTYPTALLIGAATVTIHVTSGASPDHSVSLKEYMVGCLMTGDEPIEFGQVHLGDSASVTVYPSAECHEFQGVPSFYEEIEIEDYGSEGVGVWTFQAQPSFLGSWLISFSPVDPMTGLAAVGDYSASLRMLDYDGTVCDPSQGYLHVHGTGIP